MNDPILGQRLRELCVPPPARGFELRLREALLKEAQALPAPARRVTARQRAARRWTGRAGLTLAVVLGASAAAAAAGWMKWAPREETREGSRVIPAASESRRQPFAPQSSPIEVSEEARATPPPVEIQPRSLEAPPSAPPPHSARLREPGTERSQRSVAGPTAPEGAVERPARAALQPPPPKRRRPSSPAAVPFELPGVEIGSPSASAERARGPRSSASRTEREDVERDLPKLDRTAPERGERGKSEAMRERARAREPRGRENAERGLERAREARDRNGK